MGEIRFEGVSFTYPGAAKRVLKDVDLIIRPGERLALVGHNGAGKSTLIKLLLRLYRPSAGRITVGGVDLAALAPASWRRRVGVVFQDFLRVQSTIRDNIAFGNVEAGADATRLQAVLRQSGAEAVAAARPEGLETPIGKAFQDGAELSLGEWQKLAVARAYMRTAALLILDEPASALDAKAEADVYAHFAQLSAGRTTVLISHRLGSCRMADRIVVLSGGRVIEQGSHAELTAAGGEYAELYAAQAAWYR